MPFSMIEQNYNTLSFDQQQVVYNLICSLMTLNKNKIQENDSIPEQKSVPKFGMAKGFFKYPDDINLGDDEVAELFGV